MFGGQSVRSRILHQIEMYMRNGLVLEQKPNEERKTPVVSKPRKTCDFMLPHGQCPERPVDHLVDRNGHVAGTYRCKFHAPRSLALVPLKGQHLIAIEPGEE